MALIALGVTGGIGAYKAVEIARGLQIVHRDGQMEWLQHQAPLLSRRGSND